MKKLTHFFLQLWKSLFYICTVEFAKLQTTLGQVELFAMFIFKLKSKILLALFASVWIVLDKCDGYEYMKQYRTDCSGNKCKHRFSFPHNFSVGNIPFSPRVNTVRFQLFIASWSISLFNEN